MRPFFENNVLQQQPFKPMIIVVDTTKAGSASNTFVLPIIKAASETVKIYWGDGTNSIGVNGNNTHVYAASGVYTVKIESKIFGGVYFITAGDKEKLLSIRTFGRGIIRSLYHAFSGCSNLAIINDPTLINTSELCIYAFFGCSSLTALPLIDLSRATNTIYICYQCTSLSSVPLINLSNVTNTSYMFYQCTSLSSVSLINLSNVTNTNYMFYQCSALTNIPLLNLSSVTNAAGMFLGCTLTTKSYSDFLINLATLPLQSGVSFHGGYSKYNVAGGVARAYLISNFGWTIADGGAA